MGIDYKLDFERKGESENKFLEFKLASVFRDKVEERFVAQLSIKNSNLLVQLTIIYLKI